MASVFPTLKPLAHAFEKPVVFASARQVRYIGPSHGWYPCIILIIATAFCTPKMLT